MFDYYPALKLERVNRRLNLVKFPPKQIWKYFQIFHAYFVLEYIFYNTFKFDWISFINEITAVLNTKFDFELDYFDAQIWPIVQYWPTNLGNSRPAAVIEDTQ